MTAELSRPSLIPILFVVINLVIALFIVGDYGRGTNETSEFRRASVVVDRLHGTAGEDENSSEFIFEVKWLSELVRDIGSN